MPEPGSREHDDLIRTGIGENIHLDIHELDSGVTGGRVRIDSVRLAREAAVRVMELAGFPDDKDLRRLCAAVAEVAMGRLVTSPGFTVSYGEYFNPREMVRVNLRPEPVRSTNIDATVTETIDG